MRKWLGVLVISVLIAGQGAAIAGNKGASRSAYEHASDQSIFNRIGDWFATVGKSDEEKQKILTERKAARAAKMAEKKMGEAKEEMKKTKIKTEKKMNVNKAMNMNSENEMNMNSENEMHMNSEQDMNMNNNMNMNMNRNMNKGTK